MVQECPSFKEKIVLQAQLDLSKVSAADAESVCAEMRADNHDNDCFRAVMSTPRADLCEGFGSWCDEFLPEGPTSQECPVLMGSSDGELL